MAQATTTTAATAHRTLKTVLFMGSARDIVPPWGGPKRLGDGILQWVTNEISNRTSSLGEEEIKHDLTIYDPLEVFGKGGALELSGAEIKTPHFFFKKGTAPESMDVMAKKIKDADCFLLVCPEYNHSIPPALSGMMGHFGGSNYAYKPSGIITYSPSPYGGARVTVALRPFLSELGCLPVSKMACFSMVGDLFDEGDGSVKEKDNRQLKQLEGLMEQLEWFAVACANQRDSSGVP